MFVVLLMMLHPIQELEPPANPARFNYLQLLDQKRSNPPLEEQVRALKKFAIECGAVVVLISQIDRAFELSSSNMPTLADIRLPNPVDLSLFDKKCFLHDGQIQIEAAA